MNVQLLRGDRLTEYRSFVTTAALPSRPADSPAPLFITEARYLNKGLSTTRLLSPLRNTKFTERSPFGPSNQYHKEARAT